MTKAFSPCKSLVKLLFITLLLSNFCAFAQKTVIYVVRHAEKDLSDTSNHDPKLSILGQQRALDLAEMFKREKIDAFFTTPFKRSIETVMPLAIANKMQPLTYTDAKAIAAQIMQEYKGKTVLVVGHSNIIIPIVNAFGAKAPLHELVDDDYDLLFTVIVEGYKPIVYTKRYGRPHHITDLP